jgi:NTP pyrophosphatase (non-canonical NTP hydrolase)
MNLTNEFQPIRDWATEKGILDQGDPKTQTLKLMEEVGELSKAILERRKEDIEDALGDCVVVLTSLAHLNGLKLEDCVNLAYMQILPRTGMMQNNTFIKDNG